MSARQLRGAQDLIAAFAVLRYIPASGRGVCPLAGSRRGLSAIFLVRLRLPGSAASVRGVCLAGSRSGLSAIFQVRLRLPSSAFIRASVRGVCLFAGSRSTLSATTILVRLRLPGCSAFGGNVTSDTTRIFIGYVYRSLLRVRVWSFPKLTVTILVSRYSVFYVLEADSKCFHA